MKNTKFDRQKTLSEIINRFKQQGIKKIILFGSMAKGNVTEDSDIDLVIITDSDKIIESFEDRLKEKLKFRNLILDLSKTTPIDLLLFTKAEFKFLSEQQPSFINELKIYGRVIYEKTDKILA
ncbi:MAG: nucleotidyltransferase domain-containing protein [Caldisericaceae bacterium]|nr:nucleotidyltransferase domain-containing protein [Caldisericaceae bacterium]